MKSILKGLSFCLTMAYVGAAWAGSSTNGGPSGDSGSSGSEPEMIALILFSLIPGVFFVRKAIAARGMESDDS